MRRRLNCSVNHTFHYTRHRILNELSAVQLPSPDGDKAVDKYAPMGTSTLNSPHYRAWLSLFIPSIVGRRRTPPNRSWCAKTTASCSAPPPSKLYAGCSQVIKQAAQAADRLGHRISGAASSRALNTDECLLRPATYPLFHRADYDGYIILITQTERSRNSIRTNTGAKRWPCQGRRLLGVSSNIGGMASAVLL